MTPVEKALWYIESQFREPFTVQDVARASGVTPSYLIRAFGHAIGMSVRQYVKARRLSEAAKALAAGAPDILSVAIMTGYQSHEAFGRAIRDYFGIAPSKIRELASTANLNLLEPVMLSANGLSPLHVSVETLQSREISGLAKRYDSQSKATIPSMWHELDQQLGRIEGQIGVSAYGVCSAHQEDGTFSYLCGVETSSTEFTGAFNSNASLTDRISIPAGTYASFLHQGHISTIRNSWCAVYNEWLPTSDYQLDDTPEFELYSDDFDPIGNSGTVKLFIPLKGR